MHTQEKDDKVQFAVTLTPATTKAEKKNKATSGGATERIRRDISYPKVRGWEGLGGTWHGTQIHSFEGLIDACDENSVQWLSAEYCTIVILRAVRCTTIGM
jgi:hypothetical protein